MTNTHSFHIPVMGIAYTIDTPLKIAQYGIDSVISLVDDMLFEKLRKMYCEKFQIPYHEISVKIKDFRAKRITAYLNLVNDISKKKFEDLKNSGLAKNSEFKKYLTMLPDNSEIKKRFNKLKTEYTDINKVYAKLKDSLSRGSIDVNIMTKLDKANYIKGEKLPDEFNDAHAALRGYAKSDLSSSIILSAGMNPRLYSYIEKFEDFYPDKTGYIKKKIVLKVSDYRSALIQGKFLAKKGLWVSEYRVESGLNCGGHAFATDGDLMGPILAAFKENREELNQSINEILTDALLSKKRPVPTKELSLKITAQGGVGTTEEHQFLMDEYGLDSVGWGSPFLLVPEATTVDDSTLNQLIDAKEEDLYLSNISPLGVPFNSLRGNSKDIEKLALINQGKAGSTCPKKYLTLNNEYGDKPICTASRQYQNKKLKEFKNEKLSYLENFKKKEKLFEKSCICVGLGTSALLAYNLDTKIEGAGVSVCPGPNLAYFSQEISLENMINHIYRKTEFTNDTRPNMFIKELNIYIKYIQDKIKEIEAPITIKQQKYFLNFIKNLKSGISYYFKLFLDMEYEFNPKKFEILSELIYERENLKSLTSIVDKIKVLKKKPVLV